ncbi:hypothetical protein [Salinispora arenicola]|uniref:hypothetical protein n=1 Tax=Salinispora arenicola TaxID=168697 RepID=UPI00169E1D9E|nr:hypothetical protein [Salinispora arenicola]NIL59030.1 hypothetical protein [Salinispora arenicola]NIL60115.1 hypothetical protein [Salinispora arenicola]
MPPQAVSAPSDILTFVLSGVAAVLLTRAYLQATGFPQFDAGGLRIAHVLWGGLLLTVGFGVVLVFLGSRARFVGAILGGIGFGLFIDQVGKFVTAQADYFYAPAAGIIYAAFALLLVITQALRERTRLSRTERTANALDTVIGGLDKGLSDRRRSAVLRLVRDCGPDVTEAVARLLATVPRREPSLAPLRRPWARRARQAMTWVVSSRWMVGLVVVYLLGEPLVVVARVGVEAVVGDLPNQQEWGAVLGVASSALATAVLSIRGALLLPRDEVGAFRLFRLAILVDLLFGQVFSFTVHQFGALVGLAIDLFLLAVITVKYRELCRNASA